MQSQDTQKAQSTLAMPFYAEVQQLANEQKLGELRASFTTTLVNGARLIANAVVWFFIALVGLYFLVTALTQIRAVISDSEELQSFGAMALIGAALFVAGLYLGGRSLREFHYRHREQVHIFADGFVYLKDPLMSRDKLKSIVVRWDAISVLIRGRLDIKRTGRILRDSISISTDKNERIYLRPRLQHVMELCDIIEQDYTSYRFPGIFELYKLGEELEFGDIVISKEGVSRFINNDEDEETLDWDDVASLQVDNNFTRVYTRDHPSDSPWIELATVDVENALLLRRLLQQIAEYHDDDTDNNDD